MRSLSYVSSASQVLEVPDLVDLLDALRPRNEERGLTGMLLHGGGNLIQTLEGPDEVVETTFAGIERNPPPPRRARPAARPDRGAGLPRLVDGLPRGRRRRPPGGCGLLRLHGPAVRLRPRRQRTGGVPAAYRMLALFCDNMR